jgi:hypothetical protein
MVAPSHFLSKPKALRKAAHSRSIHLQSYEREDGLWDLEALIEDLKAESFTSQTTHFDCGVPIHRMPFPTICPEAGLRVERLVGANLLKGFRKEITKRLPADERCSHISELAALLPTLAIQTMMPRMAAAEKKNDPSAPRPLKIGGCHAWREDSPLVLKYYPNWYRKPES